MPTPSVPRPSRTRQAVTALALAALAWTTAGCTEKTDLGRECTLTRRATATELQAGSDAIVDIRESEISAGQDFLSFGVTGCDDLVCVHDASSPLTGTPTASVKGYCTRPCAAGDACEVTDSAAVPGVAETMACRPLVLDEATLAAIRAADPDFYRANFGESESSAFCAASAPAPAAP